MTTATFNFSRSQQPAGGDAGATAPASAHGHSEPSPPGRVLSGRLRIERAIGMGSMGMVFEGRHLELDTRVAVKAILPEMQEVPGMLALFAREAKAAVGIRSEHVAQVLDVGTDDVLGPYIVMEYLEGEDLKALLDREGRLPPVRAIDYILQACEALAVAHARGVIHRDIKPGNLFLTRQGELEIIKLLDFGVSKAALTGRLFGGELSGEEAAELRGTPLYMSPEQVRAPERVDERSDIWALGAVLYELVTGHNVFPGSDDLPTLLLGICDAAPRPLSEYDRALEPLQGIIDQCLDKNPARRFQSVAELAYALYPLASPRAQPHAQRAASILGTPGARAAAPASAFAPPAPPRELLASRFVGDAPGTPMWHPPAAPRARPSGASRWVPLGLLLVMLLLGPGASEPLAPAASGVSEASLAAAASPAECAVLVEPSPGEARSERMALQQLPVGPGARAPAAARARAALATKRRAPARAAAPRPADPLPEDSASSTASTPATPKALVPPERPRLRLVQDPGSAHVASRL